PEIIARYTDADRERLLADPGIIRSRSKIDAAIGNARAYLALREAEGGLAPYVWGFVDGEPIINRWRSMAEAPTTTALSDRLSKDLKKRGFRFVGSTIVYSYLQAVGVISDHVVDCFRHPDRA
ncbi:DNA-3-methyladenine glycosylase I, partial [Algiphilus sp.]|uniref:DNA-3-methyladenine glycosylase I n=1 Tax=Algiphilus sp. TaxID=1872431 RepID=UPI003C56B34A